MTPFQIDPNRPVPLHSQIRDGIQALIRDGAHQPGDLLFTEVGLSRQFGVSLGPIRQAINHLVAEGLLIRRRAKGVFLAEPQQTAAQKVTFVIPDVGHSFYGSMLRGGEQCARQLGYDLLVANSDFDLQAETDILGRLAQTEPHAVVLCHIGGDQCRRQVEELIARGFVVVMVDTRLGDLPVDTVENDNLQIGLDATNHLLAHGHRRIVHLTSSEWPNSAVTARRDGYANAMVQAGLQPVVQTIHQPGDRWEIDVERRVTQWIESLSQPLPTAIFAINDTECVGIIRGLIAAGLDVPTDLSLIGCADLDLARALTVPLTTIDQDSYGMGRRAVQRAVDRLEGRLAGDPTNEIHPHRLVERMTVRELGSHATNRRRTSGQVAAKSIKP